MKKSSAFATTTAVLLVALITVPSVRAQSSTATTGEASSDQVHIVAPGETLYSIARQHGMTVGSLTALNNLEGTIIQPGQTLRLSGAAPAGTTYRVKPGDTLWSISKRNNTTVAALQRLNGISGTAINVGQDIRLSGAPAGSTASENMARADRPNAADAVDHDDASGSIVADEPEAADEAEAERSPDTLASAGAATAVVSSGGGRPDTDSSTVTAEVAWTDGSTAADDFDRYTISEADTWESVAAQYRISADSLRILNGGATALPDPGATLRVPIDRTVFQYTVEEGDNLARIARWFTVDEEVIRELNDLPRGGDVTPGQVLRIPDLDSPILKDDGAAKASRPERKKEDSKAAEKSKSRPAGWGAKAEKTMTDDAPMKEPAPVDAPAEESPAKAAAEAASNSDARSQVRIYPESFKGRLMANGTAYNPRRSTISHPTAAFGTQVRVTNLATGASAFAIVADRPLPGSTQVDISKALAVDLAIEKTGDVQVMIETVE